MTTLIFKHFGTWQKKITIIGAPVAFGTNKYKWILAYAVSEEFSTAQDHMLSSFYRCM